ncbi:MAG: protein phosphatase [Blastopirellula sp.]|nr:MAG: protein phosphatase [Blastopirellula sp.]
MAAAPTTRCFWVIEDQFLAGAYPGSLNPDEHSQRLSDLWSAGVRTFINLMEEDETNNHNDPFVAYEDVLGVLAREHGDPVSCLRFPVVDLSIPSKKKMQTILDAIDDSLAANRSVYLHCHGGIGRTGTAVCCWMLRHGYATPEKVIELLRELRQADLQTKNRKAPENRNQIDFVTTWLENEAEKLT